MVTWTVNIK